MNQFSPMSQDNTPRPHQRFFGAGNDNQNQPIEPAINEEFEQNAFPTENNPKPAEEQPVVKETPAPRPEEAAPAAEPAPQPAEAELTPAEDTNTDTYYEETREHLLNIRKERNSLILKIDKLEDERIAKGEIEFDTLLGEVTKLQNELWRKNNLIDALVKVLISLE